MIEVRCRCYQKSHESEMTHLNRYSEYQLSKAGALSDIIVCSECHTGLHLYSNNDINFDKEGFFTKLLSHAIERKRNESE